MRLYNNPEKQERECSKCHQIKPYSEFKSRSDNPMKKRSVCKKCAIKMEANRLQMKSWIHKIHAIRFVTNDLNRCQICSDISIDNLPMLDFHHPEPELSTQSAREKGFWRSVRYKPWDFIKNELVNQKLNVICRNCHSKIQASFFYEYCDIIRQINDPNIITSEMISNKILREEIKAHIRKKIVFLDLWNGKCSSCGFGVNKNDIENLPALLIHHQIPELKENIWHRLRKIPNIEEIKSILKREFCTCLCDNCHIMIQSTFFNENKAEIFERYSSRYC